MRSRSSQRPREACGTVYAGAWPQVHWPRVSRGGQLVTEVRRQRQSSSPPRPFQRPGRSLKADWLDERPTSNGAVWITGDDILPPGTPGGGGCSAAGPPSPPPSPRDLQRCLKVRPVGSACARHRAPPRYTKCACGRTLTDHRSLNSSTDDGNCGRVRRGFQRNVLHVGRRPGAQPGQNPLPGAGGDRRSTRDTHGTASRWSLLRWPQC